MSKRAWPGQCPEEGLAILFDVFGKLSVGDEVTRGYVPTIDPLVTSSPGVCGDIQVLRPPLPKRRRSWYDDVRRRRATVVSEGDAFSPDGSKNVT